MTKKIECDLKGCKVKFTLNPRGQQQRFCCPKHRDRWHQLERAILIKMARAMGVRR